MSQDIVDNAKKIEEDFKTLGHLFRSDIAWTIKRLLEYREGLFKYAKFKYNERVVLAVTPKIDPESAPGWMGCQHFLIKGAQAVVRAVDYYDGEFTYDIMFDRETWLDSSTKEEHPTTRRHVFHFRESQLRADPEKMEANP